MRRAQSERRALVRAAALLNREPSAHREMTLEFLANRQIPAWASRVVKGFVKGGSVTIVTASLVLVGLLVAWPHLFSSGPSRLPPGRGSSLIGEAEGWVKSAEPSTSTILVSSGFLGLSSVTLVVTPDTLIIVGGKEGGFDDIYEGRRVRAAYEERPGGLYAKSVEVVVDDARTGHRQAIGQPAPPQNPSTSTVGRLADDDRRPDRSTSGPVGDSPGARARKPMAPQTISGVASRDMAPAAAPRANKRQTDSKIEPQAPGAAPSTRRSVTGEPPPDNRRSSPPPNIRSDGATQARDAELRQVQEADPAAVIDWLLKRSPLSSQ